MGAMKWAGTNARWVSAVVPAVWCIVLGLGHVVSRAPQQPPRFFFLLGSLWSFCPWNLSVNYFFSLGTGLGREYFPCDSSLQILLPFPDLL